MKKLLICFAAGCLGALVNSLTVWIFGDLGVSKQLGVALSPHLSTGWLYPRIVWGGIWGGLFLLPLLRSKPVLQGSVLSLAPTAVQLLYVFPVQAHKGIGGIELGLLTPLLVIFFNIVWGVVTAITIKLAR
ncbi:MAG: hypothetical protein WBB19_05910 [Desulforhopalus sp.]